MEAANDNLAILGAGPLGLESFVPGNKTITTHLTIMRAGQAGPPEPMLLLLAVKLLITI